MIFNTTYAPGVIRTKRKKIAARLMAKSPNIKGESFQAISNEDLALLFQLYDAVFLNNWACNIYQGKVKFSLSRRMTRSAGLTKYPKNIAALAPQDQELEIRIGVDFFFNFGVLKGNKPVCGLQAKTPLEALMLVFEHEICHVLELATFGHSSCGANRFRTLAKNLFGHKESHHALPSYSAIADQTYGLKVGDMVLFNHAGETMSGTVHKITKRATVMVRDDNGPFIDKAGNRYSKYYVPLSVLEKES